MKRSLFALGLAAIASSSFAYNAQLDGGFSYADHKNNYTDTDYQFGLKGTFYFNPVLETEAPLNETAFLGHNSNAYVGYTYNYVENTANNMAASLSEEISAHHLGGGIEYFVEQFYLNGEIGFGQLEDKYQLVTPLGRESYSKDSDLTTYRVLVGYMPLSNLLFAAGIDGFQGDHDHDDNRFAVRAKYVAPLAQGQFINLEANGAFGDTDSVMVAADYYLDHAFSFGAAYSIEDDGKDDADFFSIRSKYFINSNFAVGGAVGFGDDVQALNINATYRF